MIAALERVSKTRKGFVLVAFSLALLFILGCVGMAVDIGRMYVVRNESQVFCDAAAIAAAAKLNGDTTGIDNAIKAVKDTCPGEAMTCLLKYDFGNTSFPADRISIRFAKNDGTAWDPNPSSATDYVIAEVTTSVNLPMLIMPVVTRQFQATIKASATAKQIPQYNAMDHVWPLSPSYLPPGGSNLADPDDPYGMYPARAENGTLRQGGIYNLREPSNIKDASDLCANEQTNTTVDYLGRGDQPFRNWLWDTHGNTPISDAILGSQIPDDLSISIGQRVDPSTGSCSLGGVCLIQGDRNNQPNIIDLLVDPTKQHPDTADSDTSSPNYATYVANGSGSNDRVVVVAINSGVCTPGVDCPKYPPSPYAPADKAGTEAEPGVILGFAGFYLLTENYDYKNIGGNEGICAEYIGPWTPNQASGTGGPGMYLVKLVQ